MLRLQRRPRAARQGRVPELPEEMQSGGSRDDVEDAPVSVDESTIGLNSVSTMDEIIPEIEEDIPANEYGDIQNELSLESVIEDENEDDDEDKDDDDR